MYNIPYFKATDHQEVLGFMRAHPFIILCGADDRGQPVATHVPVLFEHRGERLFLLAHVMKKQLHTAAFQKNNRVLAIFYGPHTYVSASWYQNQQIASTWNYQAVHAQGILHFLNEDGLRSILTKLTEKFENNPHSPALVQKMEEDYLRKMMEAIVAFEIEITTIEHVFKLSQNRDEKSYHNIVEHLSQGDAESQAVADEMKKRVDGND
jgi:transcriptional regulator